MSSFASSKRIPDDPLIRKIYATGLSTTSVTFVNATGAVFSVEANKRYLVEFFIEFRGSNTSTGGIAFAVSAPTSPTRLMYLREAQSNVDTSLIFESGVSNDDTNTATPGVASTSISYFGRVTVMLKNGANAGNVQLRFRSETAAVSVSIENVFGRCTEMP